MTPSAEADRQRDQARAIWQAAVDTVHPQGLLRAALANRSWNLLGLVESARHILIVGAGKAGASMAAAIEEVLAPFLDRLEGLINVPAETVRPLHAIRLHPARPSGSNQPTAEGVVGAEQILDLVSQAGPEDVCFCLLSGGGSALLPAPVAGVSLEDKQQVTRLLHACGATINEMNTVRKHLSRIKGGHLARAFRGRELVSLIISDVVGDPIDVIASGPTAADPTTFADALAVLNKYDLVKGRSSSDRAGQVPTHVMEYLQEGASGARPETLKVLTPKVRNLIIGNNAMALEAASAQAEAFGYRVLNCGAYLEGETRSVAVAMAGIIRSIQADGQPMAPPVCLLSGGETTVTLAPDHGLGGRNQEFVLAMANKLGVAGLKGVLVLSGGTDGEDGPTDAAGAIADLGTLDRAARLGLAADDFLRRNDAYRFFSATGDLLKTGLTQTNVMDVRVILVG
jgi:hydroxypyruvate reductase/glycerate 2-kinase